jgi:hypothetical protein
MLIKPNKNPHIIFDALSKGDPHDVSLNNMTATESKANITFGMGLLFCLIRPE